MTLAEVKQASRIRRQQQADQAQAAYDELVQQALAGELEAKDTQHVEEVLADAGMTMEDLTAHVERLREREDLQQLVATESDLLAKVRELGERRVQADEDLASAQHQHKAAMTEIQGEDHRVTIALRNVSEAKKRLRHEFGVPGEQPAASEPKAEPACWKRLRKFLRVGTEVTNDKLLREAWEAYSRVSRELGEAAGETGPRRPQHVVLRRGEHQHGLPARTNESAATRAKIAAALKLPGDTDDTELVGRFVEALERLRARLAAMPEDEPQPASAYLIAGD